MRKGLFVPTAILIIALLSTHVWAAPTVSTMRVGVEKGTVLSFTKDDFTSKYSDTGTNPQALDNIMIRGLPAKGTLVVSGGAVAVGEDIPSEIIVQVNQVIPANDLDSLKYVPPSEDFTGEVFVYFRASNGKEYDTSSTEIQIVVDELPTARSAEYTTDYYTPITGKLETQSSDTGKYVSSLTYEVVADKGVTHGTLSLNSSTGVFVYTPQKGLATKDEFSFVVKNILGASDRATISITVTEPVIPFIYEDMLQHWANYSASHLADQKIIIGDMTMGDNLDKKYFFSPQKGLTKQDFIVFVLALRGIEPMDKLETSPTFADEDITPSWFLPYAYAAYEHKIISGSPDAGGNLFLNASKTLSRSEAFVILDNALNLTDTTVDVSFADNASVPNWAMQSLKNLVGFGIVTGSNDIVRPLSALTRGEAAELLYKSFKELEKSASTTGLVL